MNKDTIVKLSLIALIIAFTAGPLIGVVFIYRDNLMGLVLPPQIGGGSSLSSAESSLTNNGTSDLDSTDLASVPPVKPLGNPTYDNSTGVFSYPFSFTNPLPVELSFDSLSADIKTSNGELLGTITIPDAMHIRPGQSAVIAIDGSLDQTALDAYLAQFGSDALVSVENLIVTVGGISLHLDEVPELGAIRIGELYGASD